LSEQYRASKQAAVQLDSIARKRAVLLAVNGRPRMIGEGTVNQKAKLKIVGAKTRVESIFQITFVICHCLGTIITNDK
jgi:hypothetical protein